MEPEDDANGSRRQFVGSITAGLAAAFVSPAFGQQGQQESRPPLPCKGLASPVNRTRRRSIQFPPSPRKNRSRPAL